MKESIIICVQYKMDQDLIGGMDRYCWAMDEKLTSLGMIPKWFFPKSSLPEHYRQRDLDIVYIDHKDFLQGVYEYLEVHNIHPEIMLTHFTRYFTKEMRWFKKLGVGRIISFEHLFRDQKNRPLIVKIKTAVKGSLFYRYCDKVAFVSEYVYRQAINEYWPIKLLIIKRISVVYNGIDTNAYRIGLQKKEEGILKIVCACRIVKAKGLLVLIEAVEGLERTGYGDKFQIDVYGAGQDKIEFEKIVAEKELKRIRFLNNANNLNELLNTYDTAVFPTFGEAHPFFVLESFASGLPVIASKVGGIPEMINEERGFLIEPGSVKELNDAIVYCINNKEKLPEMGLKGRDYVLSDFTLEHMVQRHLSLLGIGDN